MQKEITENYPARKYKRIKTKQKGKDRKTEIVRESKGQKRVEKSIRRVVSNTKTSTSAKNDEEASERTTTSGNKSLLKAEKCATDTELETSS